MGSSLPRQRRGCGVYDWCVVTGHDHAEHTSRMQVIAASEDRELRIALRAEHGRPPYISLEVVFTEDGPPMEVTGLDAAAALELAGALLRLAKAAHDSNHGHARA